MGAVIYSASPFQAFLGAIGTIVLLFGLGVVGIGGVVLRHNQGRTSRILTGVFGVLLLIASCAFAAVTLVSYSTGTRQVTLQLSNKTIANDNCGDNGETCTRYVLEATTPSTAYDFDVPQDAYDKVQVNTCYQITYYQNNGLFNNSGDASSSYQRIDTITQIVESTGCQ